MLITAALVDKSTPVGFAVPITASFLSMTEAISIFENISKLGFLVPTKLLSIHPNANGQAIVDSNDIFVRYKKTFAQQGENIQAKLTAGRVSIADSSRVENLNLIYSE
jgi:hypothetical protein